MDLVTLLLQSWALFCEVRICLPKDEPSHCRFSVSVTLFVNILRVIDTVVIIKSGLNSTIWCLHYRVVCFCCTSGYTFCRKNTPSQSPEGSLGWHTALTIYMWIKKHWRGLALALTPKDYGKVFLSQDLHFILIHGQTFPIYPCEIFKGYSSEDWIVFGARWAKEV